MSELTLRLNEIVVDGCEVLTGPGVWLIAHVYQNQGRRIVACVNACKEWPTESLEEFVATPNAPSLPNALTAEINRGIALSTELAAEKAKVARLVEALEPMTKGVHWITAEQVEAADAALASVKEDGHE